METMEYKVEKGDVSNFTQAISKKDNFISETDRSNFVVFSDHSQSGILSQAGKPRQVQKEADKTVRNKSSDKDRHSGVLNSLNSKRKRKDSMAKEVKTAQYELDYNNSLNTVEHDLKLVSSKSVDVSGKHYQADQKIKLPVKRNQMEFLASDENINDGGRSESFEGIVDTCIKVNKQRVSRNEESLSHNLNGRHLSKNSKPKDFAKRWNSTKDLRHNDQIATVTKQKTKVQGHDKGKGELHVPFGSKGENSKQRCRSTEGKTQNRNREEEASGACSKNDIHLNDDVDSAYSLGHSTKPIKMFETGEVHSLEFVNSSQRSASMNNLKISRSQSYTKHMDTVKKEFHNRLSDKETNQALSVQQESVKTARFVSKTLQKHDIKDTSKLPVRASNSRVSTKRSDLKNSVVSSSSSEMKRAENTEERTSSAVSENSSTMSEKKKMNEFIVYVFISEHISANSDIKAYLSHRMGRNEKIKFEITNVVNKQAKTLKAEVTVLFPSKGVAMKAVDLMNKSNRNAENRIICSYTSDKEDRQGEERERKQQSDFDKSAKQAVETAKTALDKHELLIRDAAAKLEEIEKNLSTRRGVSLEVFNSLLQEKQAREDKLSELKLQRKEFQRFLNSMKEKLTSMKPSEKEETIDIRKSLGAECHRLEAALPMYARREDMLKTINSNKVCVLLGETGSGKSTQLVQYLYQAGYAQKGLIACTQPRKIAAISLAKHVSIELGSRVGQVVGYQIGMKTDKSKDTKIMFMTDHVLLNECLKDETLSQFSCVIIDEAHERSIYTDLLLGMIKKCLSDRPDLRIVITSATIKPDIFVSYFGGEKKCPVLKVSGRTFPVEVVWDDDDVYGDPFPEDYERKSVNKAVEVHTNVPMDDGDILVFVTSPTESEKCCEKFSKKVTERNFQCLQLHGKLKQEEQQLVFEPAQRGVRKVVFATNSAETSITIPGVKYVIDTGVVKEMRYDAKKKMNCLSVVPVSQSSADQRKGRAGRTSPGTCYRLYNQNDYFRMEKNSKPEILRVNLGQALLKLLQLKVDPLSFDFVESPDKAHMSAVMENLRQLGAVEKNELTDLGKWIANLPLEPRLGVLVKNGLELEVPVEAIVVATCTSAGSVFYRAGTLEEKKKCDLKKLKFCHPGGDLLTALNVYREWDGVNEKAKGSWCVTNSVNGKTMKGIRESVKEIVEILKKEMKIEVKYELCPVQKADKEIQRLLIKCMMSNLCFYLGHERAGYITTDLLQHVQIHPSSSLVCLGQQPKWIVYEQILKTTGDFVTNIAPVSGENIEELVFQGQTSLNRENIESRVVSQVCKIPVGKYVFWKFVGPFHRGRQEIEELMRNACDNTLVVIDADKQKGEITLYASRQYRASAYRFLKNMLNSIPAVLMNEAREVPIGDDKSGVRAVIGPGGCVVDVLMPTEYRSLNIKQKPYYGYDLTEDELKDKFSMYGPVDQVWQAKGKKQNVFWGKVTFLRERHAVAAAADVNSDETEPIEVVPVIASSVSKNNTEYTVRLSWCRRLGKGIAYVDLECPEDEVPLIVKSPIMIGDNIVDIHKAKRDNLMIRGLSAYVSEDEIKEALADVLGVTLPPDSTRFKIIIPREPAKIPATQMDRAYQQLEAEVSSLSLRGHFQINIKDVKEQTARFTAFVRFTDPNDCETIMEKCADDLLFVNSAPVEASMDLKTSVVVQKNVFEVVRPDIDSFTQKLRRKGSSTTVKRRELKSGNTVLDICSSSPRRLAKAKTLIHGIVDGETLDCESTPRLYHLFTRRNREVITDIEKCTRTLILMDQRTFNVTVHGFVEFRQIAIQELRLFLDSFKDAEEIEMTLKGEGNPPGVMKELIIQYGFGLNGLKETADLAKVSLNCKLHKVTMMGTNEAIAKGDELIQAVKKKLSTNTKVVENEMPDCPICICPVELSQVYRLEYCGHAYCRECLKSLILNGLTDKKFPIQCAAEGCGKDIVIRDISIHIKQGAFTTGRLVTAAVDCLVAKNSSSYHYCLTPNCEMVYKITSPGELFKCPLCFCRICTACHIQYHDGMSCAMFKSAKSQDDSVKKWIREKPHKRKRCPKCDVGIEKYEGCNHVLCLACGAHICWVCLQFFSKESQCYGHMETGHGSFV